MRRKRPRWKGVDISRMMREGLTVKASQDELEDSLRTIHPGGFTYSEPDPNVGNMIIIKEKRRRIR